MDRISSSIKAAGFLFLFEVEAGGIVTEHYYSKKPNVDSAPQTWHAQLRDETYTFTSDKGVFSKGEVDFGSRLIVEKFKEPEIKGDILDLGCGYGPIGIALAHAYSTRRVVLSDVNERALFLANKNKDQNHINNISVINSIGFSELMHYTFAAIVTNPPIRAGKKVIYTMFRDAKEVLKKNGQLWVVIQKKQGAPSAKVELQEVFGNVTIVSRSRGFFILRSTNT